MILINATNGRTGNQLVILTHLFASSLEHNISFFNFGQTPDKDFIIQTKKGQRSRYLPVLVKLSGWLTTRSFTRKLLAFFGIRVVFNFCAKANALVPLFKETALSHKHLMPFVWPYTDYKALYKHQEECRAFITPKRQYTEQAEQIITRLRQGGRVLIGIHVRRTDYKTWFKGKYYFDTAVYEKAMQETAALCPNGAHFVICSDEKLTTADFPAISPEQIYFSNNPFITDFVLLASCDYIIGPPSTFSGYASFYGKAKKLTLFSAKQTITSLEQFGVVMIDYDDITECRPHKGDVHREYLKLEEGNVISRSVPTLES